MTIRGLAVSESGIGEAANPTWRIRRIEIANPLIFMEPTPKGLHYTVVAGST
jgi:hypothetical protein